MENLPKILKAHAARTVLGQFSENAEQRSNKSSKFIFPSCLDENTRNIESRNGLCLNKIQYCIKVLF